MNNISKKISTFTLAILLIAPFSWVNADIITEENISDYIFYLEFVQYKPKVSTDVKTPYYIIPVAEHAPTLSSGEFRGDIISGKGKLLTSFWFNTPTTTIVALNKSRADIRAPYFANADHVSFYTNNGTKPLFTISLKASSFCNDNNKCEGEVGENYSNCANDCPAPVKTTTTPTKPSVTPSDTTETPTITEPTVNLPGTNEGTTTRATTPESSGNSSVIQLTIGIFLVLLSFVGYFAWKRVMSSEGIE